MNAGPYYRIGPFRDWLIHQIARHERMGWEVNEFASLCGVTERHLYRWINETQVVSLNHVDRVVTRFGDPGLLNELCPMGSEVTRNLQQVKCDHGPEDRVWEPSGRSRCRRCTLIAQRKRRERDRKARQAQREREAA